MFPSEGVLVSGPGVPIQTPFTLAANEPFKEDGFSPGQHVRLIKRFLCFICFGDTAQDTQEHTGVAIVTILLENRFEGAT